MDHARTDVGELSPMTWAELPRLVGDIDERRTLFTPVSPTIADVERAAMWVRRRRRHPPQLWLSVKRGRRLPARECVPCGSSIKR
jgi:hypothetical protein